MIARRHLLGLLGMVPFMGTPQRPDQSYDPPVSGLAPSSQSGVFLGRRVIISGSSSFSGLFVYSPTPALGNLIASDSGVQTSDPYGNLILKGRISYFNTGSGFIAIQELSGAIAYYTASAAGGPYTQVATIQGSSPFAINANSADVTITGNAAIPGKLDIGASGLQGQVVPVNGFLGNLVLSKTDTSSPSATTTALTALTTTWQIPTVDMQVGTVYRFTASAKGTQGSSTNASSWAIAFGGVNVISGSNSAAFWGASNGIFVKVTIEIEIVALGVGGSVKVSLTELMENTNNLTDNSPTSVGGGTVAVNLSPANVGLEFDWQWASITGGPTITGQGSILERLGI